MIVINSQILILGLGNILLTDEGFGVHVIQELNKRYSFPPNVTLFDGGTGGLSLLSQFQGKDYILIVDALLLNEKPGTIAQFSMNTIPDNYQRKDTAHGIDILDVVAAAALIDRLPSITVMGAQPADISNPGLDLTPELRKAMEILIEQIINELEIRGIQFRPKKT